MNCAMSEHPISHKSERIAVAVSPRINRDGIAVDDFALPVTYDRLMRFICTTLVVMGSFCFPKNSTAQLVDVSNLIGLETDHTGGNLGAGVSFVDFTGDYIDDLSFANYEGNLVFYEGTGTGFVPLDLGLPNYNYEAKMMLWGDIDNDGDRDLFVSFRLAPNRLYLNNGDLTFTDISAESGLNQDMQKSYGACFGDYDADGFLDLYVCNYSSGNGESPLNELYKNLGVNSFGNTIFSEASATSGINQSGVQSFQGVWVDFNEDDLLDLHVIRDRTVHENQFYEQQQSGAMVNFQESASEYGLDIMINCMSNSVADFDHNGFQDVYLTAFAVDGNWLLGNDGESFSIENTNSGGTVPNDSVQVNDVCWGANWLDVDNNGYEDLHVATGFSEYTNYPAILDVYTDHPDHVFYNEGGNFSEAPNDSINVLSFATAVGDFNLDGFPDLVSHRVGPYAQVLQSTPNENHWVKIATEGVVSNFDGIGAKILIFVGAEKLYHVRFAGESYLGQNSAWEHFGLGDATSMDSVMVSWPSGIEDMFYDLPIDEHIVVIEGGGVAFPFDTDCNPSCLGCTYEEGCNYDVNATEDDGSCDFSCFVNSELCGIGTSWNDELSLCVAESEDNDCPQDISGDGLVNVFDLLILLAEFNGTCP